jgi:DNA-binding response OmpR family regulator
MTQLERPIDAPPPIILLVEDDADTRELYRAAFELEGFWMAEAPSADEAFEYAQDVMPDAILTDIGLAGDGNGIDFVRRLKALPKMSGIPILAVTGRDLRRLPEHAGLFSDILIKPVFPDVLVNKVHDLLQHSVGLRMRSAKAREKTPHLVAKSAELLEKSRRLTAGGAINVTRECPKCGTPLTWAERRVTLGVVFDYYQPCVQGCGLFCYDHGGRNFVALIQ